METFKEFLAQIDHIQHRERTTIILDWVAKQFPKLEQRIAWNQPMFTDHGTFIIGFSLANHHLAVAPERAGIVHFFDAILRSGYEHSQQLIRIPWESPVDYSLLGNIIEFNMLDKANCKTFWRK